MHAGSNKQEDLDRTIAVPQGHYDDRATVISRPPGYVSPPVPTGSRLENHYPVVEVRGGKGVTGMGVVYIVEDEGRLYAVKTFQRRFARELAFIERFIREARTWMLIGFHPNIVHAYRVEIIDAIPYLFMEYIPGDALGRHTLSEHLRQGPMPLRQVLDFALQFCEGMAHAVRAVPGLVHRDIKPDNVLVRPDGTLKITDFGLVRAQGDDDTALAALARTAMENPGKQHLTEVGSVFGTPAYMAPEQFEGAERAAEAADIYAFGCIFYEMLAGRAPFRAEDAPTMEKLAALRMLHLEVPPRALLEYRPECPEAVIDLAMRCLHKDPAQRWGSFAELRDALRESFARVCGEAPCTVPDSDAAPEQIGAQLRSITLLDGYAQAVRLKRLRERQEESPYAFHLALASYFHCQRDAQEERRQLGRALESRVTEMGSEAVRRLAELYLRDRSAEEALALVEEFAARGSVAADQVLEPRVGALVALGRLDEAACLIRSAGETRRGHWLRIAHAHAADDKQRLYEVGKCLLREVLDEICGALPQCGALGAPGFGYKADPAVLREVLAELAPAVETVCLAGEAVFFPDIGGMPDFSGPMAWLSEACGALGQCGALAEDECAMFRRLGESLGYPRRMRDYLEREEYWFWLQQALNVADRCHAGK